MTVTVIGWALQVEEDGFAEVGDMDGSEDVTVCTFDQKSPLVEADKR